VCIKPFYTPKRHNNLYCTSLVSSVCMFAANTRFLEARHCHVYAYSGKIQVSSQESFIPRQLIDRLAREACGSSAWVLRKQILHVINEYKSPRVRAEKPRLEKPSLCVWTRVRVSLLTCPSSCDGSRQSGGCVDVRESASPTERIAADERKRGGKKRKTKKRKRR